MLKRFLIIFLLLLAELPANSATLKGIILTNELSGQPMSKVWVVADGANPTKSEDFGRFTLKFPQKNPGDPVELIVKQEGYVVVNDVQLQLMLPANAEDKILTIILCKEENREEMARRFYRLEPLKVIDDTYKAKLKELEEAHQADTTALADLEKERDQAKANAEKVAEEMAKNQPGQSSELYKQAQRLFLDGKIDAAIALLDDDKLRRSVEDAIQGWRRKAHLFILKFRFDEAEKAYEMALHYINRETEPQLWAATLADVGRAHEGLGIRVEAKLAMNI
jgi:hypothetical protein